MRERFQPSRTDRRATIGRAWHPRAGPPAVRSCHSAIRRSARPRDVGAGPDVAGPARTVARLTPYTRTWRAVTGANVTLSERLAGLDPPRPELLLVILDGFGWSLLGRYADSSPLLRRLLGEGIAGKLQTQFPTTTAANITTLHCGLLVSRTGLFEWIMYEPSVEALVSPLMFSYAGDRSRDTLRSTVADPRAVLPLPSHYRTLTDRGGECVVHQSLAFTPVDLLLGGHGGRPAGALRGPAGGGAQRGGPAGDRRPRYPVVYLNQADAVAHLKGASSQAYRETVTTLLDILEDLFTALAPGTLFALTADHGHIDVDPTRTIQLNRLRPGLESHLRRWSAGPAVGPGGSPRDYLLYLADPSEAEPVRARLAALLAGTAECVGATSVWKRIWPGRRPLWRSSAVNADSG